MKYPCWSMSAKTRIWRNMAPPRQLKPKVWKRTRIRRSSFVSAFILYRKYQELILQLIRYESPHTTKPNNSLLISNVNTQRKQCTRYSLSFFIASFIVKTDFSRRFLVSGINSSSKIFSTPFLPRITGTPIETSENPYSPCR